MMYFIDLESIPARYSTQWREWIPQMYSGESETVSGTDYEGLTGGGFFDFNSTNIYKAEQVVKLGKMFQDGTIQDGDEFFFYDVWHPGVISLRYMIDLSEFKNCKIYGILHAGAYDPTDILGMKGLGNWADGFEQSMVKACDKVFVATNYHGDMFEKARGLKVYATGLPFAFDHMNQYAQPIEKKEDIIVFPHRLSPDKQPEIFDELKEYFPGYEFVRTGDYNFTKDEYYQLLSMAKFQFSASLHENWGISVFESMYLGCTPIMPNRCSYREMYPTVKLYPTKYTATKAGWKNNKEKMVKFIETRIENYEAEYERNQKAIAETIKQFCSWENIEKEFV
jgi:glycosyltransferase involved in cell wall biosynthesis